MQVAMPDFYIGSGIRTHILTLTCQALYQLTCHALTFNDTLPALLWHSLRHRMAFGLSIREGREHILHWHLTLSPANSGKPYFMKPPHKAETSWLLLPTLLGTNLLLYVQNTVECDGCIKHAQHVNLIYDHM